MGKGRKQVVSFPAVYATPLLPLSVTWYVPFILAYRGGVHLILLSAFIFPIFIQFNLETSNIMYVLGTVC